MQAEQGDLKDLQAFRMLRGRRHTLANVGEKWLPLLVLLIHVFVFTQPLERIFFYITRQLRGK
uniref:Uncharacterized protein n=1 Tax=Strigamia maritima TaxID=126957 RepID=T1INE8_STRMM